MEKVKPECKLSIFNEDSGRTLLFNIISSVCIILKNDGQEDALREFFWKSQKCRSFMELLALTDKYVDVC
jgi:hypothetical protein